MRSDRIMSVLLSLIVELRYFAHRVYGHVPLLFKVLPSAPNVGIEIILALKTLESIACSLRITSGDRKSSELI